MIYMMLMVVVFGSAIASVALCVINLTGGGRLRLRMLSIRHRCKHECARHEGGGEEPDSRTDGRDNHHL